VDPLAEFQLKVFEYIRDNMAIDGEIKREGDSYGPSDHYKLNVRITLRNPVTDRYEDICHIW
jgi:hypothetical protein